QPSPAPIGSPLPSPDRPGFHDPRSRHGRDGNRAIGLGPNRGRVGNSPRKPAGKGSSDPGSRGNRPPGHGRPTGGIQPERGGCGPPVPGTNPDGSRGMVGDRPIGRPGEIPSRSGFHLETPRPAEAPDRHRRDDGGTDPVRPEDRKSTRLN